MAVLPTASSRFSAGLASGETLPWGVRSCEGVLVRVVDQADGSSRIERWSSRDKAWVSGGNWTAFMDAPEASLDEMRRSGIG